MRFIVVIDRDIIKLLAWVELAAQCVNEERIHTLLLKRLLFLLWSEIEAICLIALRIFLLEWLAGTYHQITGLHEQKFTLLEVDIVRDEYLDTLKRTCKLKFAPADEFTDLGLFALHELIHPTLKVSIGLSILLSLTQRGLVDESLGP